MPHEPSRELAIALADLDRLTDTHPDLASPAQTLARTLAAAFGAKRPAAPAQLPKDSATHIETILRAWDHQTPAFVTITPTFDQPDFARRARAVCDALAPEIPEARSLRKTIADSPVDLPLILTRLTQDQLWGAGPATVMTSTLRHAVYGLVALPSLAPAVQQLESLGAVPPSPYATSACPFCGTIAHLAEARGLEQHRHLRCTVCAAAWHTPRLACPHCRTTNARALDSLHIEGQRDRCRLLTCRACQGKLKIISTLAPLSPPALLVADLATIHLDLAPPPEIP